MDPLFLAAPRVSTYLGSHALTNASGFFFERDERLYLVTSRHVVIDEASQHLPDRLEIELHLDAANLTRSTGFSMLLYAQGKSVWHQGRDGGAQELAFELLHQMSPSVGKNQALEPGLMGVVCWFPVLGQAFPL